MCHPHHHHFLKNVKDDNLFKVMQVQNFLNLSVEMLLMVGFEIRKVESGLVITKE